MNKGLDTAATSSLRPSPRSHPLSHPRPCWKGVDPRSLLFEMMIKKIASPTTMRASRPRYTTLPIVCSTVAKSLKAMRFKKRCVFDPWSSTDVQMRWYSPFRMAFACEKKKRRIVGHDVKSAKSLPRFPSPLRSPALCSCYNCRLGWFLSLESCTRNAERSSPWSGRS